MREKRTLQEILSGDKKKKNMMKLLSETSLRRLLSKFCILPTNAVSSEAKWLSERWIDTFEGKSAIRKRKLTLKREAERRGEEVKSKDDAEARSYVLRKKIKAESLRITQDVTFHISLLRDFVNVPSSLSFEKWLEDRDKIRGCLRHRM